MLREGPDAVPRSWFLLNVIVIGIIGTIVFEHRTISSDHPPNYLLSLALFLINVAAFWLVLQIAGHPTRLLQTFTAAAGCGLLLNIVLIVLLLAALPLLGAEGTFGIRFAVLLWSLLVDGHIIARATGQHLAIGVAIATAIFIAQLVIYSAFVTTS